MYAWTTVESDSDSDSNSNSLFYYGGAEEGGMAELEMGC